MYSRPARWRACRAACGDERPVLAVLQSFCWEPQEKFRAMAYLSIVSGARGILWYCWQEGDPPNGLHTNPALQELARGETVPRAVAALGQALVFLAPAAMLLINHLRSRKAYGDPALMEKRYRAVLNGRMEAEIAPADGRARTVSIPKKR